MYRRFWIPNFVRGKNPKFVPQLVPMIYPLGPYVWQSVADARSVTSVKAAWLNAAFTEDGWTRRSYFSRLWTKVYEILLLCCGSFIYSVHYLQHIGYKAQSAYIHVAGPVPFEIKSF